MQRRDGERVTPEHQSEQKWVKGEEAEGSCSEKLEGRRRPHSRQQRHKAEVEVFLQWQAAAEAHSKAKCMSSLSLRRLLTWSANGTRFG